MPQNGVGQWERGPSRPSPSRSPIPPFNPVPSCPAAPVMPIGRSWTEELSAVAPNGWPADTLVQCAVCTAPKGACIVRCPPEAVSLTAERTPMDIDTAAAGCVSLQTTGCGLHTAKLGPGSGDHRMVSRSPILSASNPFLWRLYFSSTIPDAQK